MSESLGEKMKRWIGIEEEYEDEMEHEENQQDDPHDLLYPQRRKAPIVAIHSPKQQLKVVVVEPQTFEDVQSIADHLKNKRPVIVNLQDMDRDTSKRIVDFMSGAVYALDGSLKKIGEAIFLFTPENVDITTDTGRMAYPEKHHFPWETK